MRDFIKLPRGAIKRKLYGPLEEPSLRYPHSPRYCTCMYVGLHWPNRKARKFDRRDGFIYLAPEVDTPGAMCHEREESLMFNEDFGVKFPCELPEEVSEKVGRSTTNYTKPTDPKDPFDIQELPLRLRRRGYYFDCDVSGRS